jgi:ABC-type transporter MlaC component
MSTVFVLAPIVMASWPILSAAATAAAVGMGLAIKESIQEDLSETAVDSAQTVEVELEDSQVSGNLATDRQIVLTKDDVEIRISRDSRGRCKVCARGKGKSKAELKKMSEEFTQKLIQSYAYHRTMTELKSKQFQVVNEEVMEDGTVRIQVRRWVD